MRIIKEEQEDYQELPIHDDGINLIIPDLTAERLAKTVCVDSDTLIYWALFEMNPDGTRKELTEDDLDFLYGKLNESVLKILNAIEKYFDIEKLYLWIRGSNNYRKKLYPLYKSNRPEKHPLTNKLYEYLETTWKAQRANSFEAEDYCAHIGRTLKQECIIAYVDHDLLEVSGVNLFNYQKNFWQILDEATGLHNKYAKLIIGENGDFANFTPKIGKSYFNKNFTLGMTEAEYEERTKIAFLKCWKTEEKATEILELAKKIIWLAEIKDLENQE